MDAGLNYEIWTPVNSGDFKRKFDVTPWVLPGSTLDLRFVDLDSGVLRVSNQCPPVYLANILAVDTANHANDIASTLMVFRDGTWIAAMIPTRKRVAAGSESQPWWEFQLEGLEWLFDRARIKAFDYPADPIREGDWIYGAPTILPQAGSEISDDQYFLDVQGASSGNYQITDGVDNTANIAWNESDPAVIATRLETDITAITDVAVSGAGTAGDPFLIYVRDPSGTALGLTITNDTTNGTVTLDNSRVGGTPSPRPWHGSIDGVTGVLIGNYAAFEMVPVGGSHPAAPAGSPSTELLRIDADAGVGTGDFAGAQVEVNLPGDVRHRAWIQAYSQTSAQTLRLVFRTQYEVEIDRHEVTLAANTWTVLEIPQFSVPVGAGLITMRVGIIEAGNADPVYLDVNNAILAPGAAEAPLGEIASDLLAPMVARNVLDWVTETWTDTQDSSSTNWDRSLNQGIRKGQSLMQFLEYESRWGYERRLVYKGTVGAGDTFDLELYNPGGADDAPADVSVSAIDSMIAASPVEEAAPGFTSAIAEGDLGEWGEYSDAALATAWGKLEGYFANKQGRESTNLDALAQQMVTDSATETLSHAATVQNPSLLFGEAFRLGDTIPVAVHAADGSITPQDLRLVGCVVVETDTLPVYKYSFGAIVFDADQAQADALRTLIRQYRALDAAGEGAVAVQDPVTTPAAPGYGGGPGTDTPTITVAPSDATAEEKARADYVCDGTADDVQIQAAINALQANPLGRWLHIFGGTIYLSAIVSLPTASGAHMRITGAGMDETIFKSVTGATGTQFRYGDNITWEHLTFDGDSIGANAWWTSSGQGDKVRMHHCRIKNFTSSGIFLNRTGGGRSEFAFCYIHNNGSNGLHAQREDGLLVTNCTITSNTAHGIESEGLTGGAVLGCVITGNNRGMYASGGTHPARRWMIIGNDISGNTLNSIWFQEGSNNVVVGNVFTGNGTDAPNIPGLVAHNVIGDATYVPGDHSGLSGADDTAIHDDTAGEISAVTEKTTPVTADLLLIEDSAASNAKKRVQIGNLLGIRSYLTGYTEDDLADSLTGSQLYRDVQGVPLQIPIVATHAGSVVGLSVASSEARTAGTATFEVFINGTGTGLTAVLDATNTQYVAASQAIGLDTFAAGDRIDVRVTTDATWTPTTADVEASVVIS